MRRIRLSLALGISAVLAAAVHRVAPENCPAQELPAPPAAATARLVLLRNGETLQGEVARDGERYVVTLSAAQIRLKPEDVQCVCDNLTEAHAALAAKAHPHDAAAQLKLAQWCLKQALHDEAAGHLTAAERLAPGDNRVAMLRRQLDLLAERPPAPRSLAHADSPVDQPGEAALGGLPSGVMENFVTTVQPLLLNQCATGACHGARSDQSWKLVRVSSGRARSRRLTLRNLEACLQMIDRQSPQASLLLARAAAVHGEIAPLEGGRGETVQPLRESQYQLLVEWVQRAAQPPRRQPASVAGQRPATEQILPPPHDSSASRTDAALTALRKKTTGGQRAMTDNAKPTESVDPLDPAAFNRRFVKPAAPRDNDPASDADNGELDEPAAPPAGDD